MKKNRKLPIRSCVLSAAKYLYAALIGAAVALVFVLLEPVEVHLDARCGMLVQMPRGMMQ